MKIWEQIERDEWNVRQWLFMLKKGKELTDSSETCHKVAGRKMLILLYTLLCTLSVDVIFPLETKQKYLPLTAYSMLAHATFVVLCCKLRKDEKKIEIRMEVR